MTRCIEDYRQLLPTTPPDPPAEASAPPAPESFSPGELRRQLWIDGVMRYGLLAGMVAAVAVLFSLDSTGTIAAAVTIVLVMAGWLALNFASAQVMRDLPQLLMLAGAKPAAAEKRIRAHLARRPLTRWARMMLYHRMAVLRHRQQRFADAAAIARSLLERKVGLPAKIRPHLLLLLTEASLELGDLGSVHRALARLHGMELNLHETLQHQALLLRYQVTAGHDAAAGSDLGARARLAELLPAPQSGTMHAMLAAAAERTGQVEKARWLRERMELLCTPEQLEELEQGRSTIAATAAEPGEAEVQGEDEDDAEA
ncbi:MAG: hypothetical protein ACOCTI_01730 [Phycisphaeraceae bacterium]